MSDHPYISIDPAIRSGEACLNHTRLPCEAIAGYVIAGDSVDHIAEEYDITRADVLAACWYMATYGTRRWRTWWGSWAEKAHEALWHSRDDAEDPPSRADIEEAQHA